MLNLLERAREWWQARRTHNVSAEKARERVRRGAAYLDDVDPEWYRRVDAETLELGDGRHCILGQLHGEFRLGLGRSHLISMSSAPRASLSPVAYGFKCVEGVPEPWQARDYELLNDAWRDAVRRRQAADPTMGEDEKGAAPTTGDSLPDDAVTLAPAREAA
jgi:hypothetical protein